MKNMKRAERRYKKQTKFLKRIKVWTTGMYQFNPITLNELKKNILEGKSHTFLKTTSRPCNCYCCTYLKYNRTPKHKVMKEAFKE